MSKERITQDRLRELVCYDPETGFFTARVVRRGSNAEPGGRLGTFSRDTLVLQLDGQYYPLHNLAWLYVHGEWPAKQLLKLDGNGTNLAIKNLALPVLAARGALTQERLKSVMSYDRETGVFRWLIRPAKNVLAGVAVGGIELTNGNRYTAVDGVEYTMQRLAWLYEHGVLPDRPLRFLDGDQSNLAIANLALPVHDARTPEGTRAYRRIYREKSFSVHKAADLRKSFGFGIDVYNLLLEQQGGVCAGCKQPETSMRGGRVKALAVDHCHETHVIRGLLCEACNTTLGKMNDDPARLRALADYIEKNHDIPTDDGVIRIVKRGPKLTSSLALAAEPKGAL